MSEAEQSAHPAFSSDSVVGSAHLPAPEAYSFAIQAAPHVTHVLFDGVLTPAEMRRACEELLATPEWSPGPPQVWDFGAVTSVQMCPEGWTELVTASRQRLPLFGANRNAAVSCDDTLSDLLRLYERTFRSTDREFFLSHSRWEAVSWLLETDEVQA